jgi:predicted metalloprotease
MRYRRGQRSEHLRDLRGRRGGIGMGRMPMAVGALGLPGILLILALTLLGGGDGGGLAFDSGPAEDTIPRGDDPDAELVDFMSFVLDDVQETWERILPEYRPLDLVLFTDAVQSGCGPASSATGPFYCPADETSYLDLSFFRELRDRFGAPGDFAQAYVLAHEIAHHVQHQQGLSPGRTNEGSVRHELMADCLAGVWARSTEERGLLEAGDEDEALRAAAAVGDDRIQRQAGARVNPETWTHGSAEQRAGSFRRGFADGDPRDCGIR